LGALEEKFGLPPENTFRYMQVRVFVRRQVSNLAGENQAKLGRGKSHFRCRAGPTKNLREQKVAAAEKALNAAVVKAQASSVGTKMTKAQNTVTNVVQDQEPKGHKLTEDANECFDKNKVKSILKNLVLISFL
ncbi:hypothetical protein scyTo_0016002, partial [Scyliorhinus torazame]|nr:hypothetical protein [Scyliorhinus torazame]